MSIHLKGEVGVCMTNFRITKKMRDAANSGEYSLTEDEICEINEHNKLVKKKRKKIKEQRNTVYECTYTLLSEKLGIEITKKGVYNKLCK